MKSANGVAVGSEWKHYTDMCGIRVTRLVVTKIEGKVICMEDYKGTQHARAIKHWHTYFVPLHHKQEIIS
jgi:hypothetical protein